jgi:hypothetical protein
MIVFIIFNFLKLYNVISISQNLLVRLVADERGVDVVGVNQGQETDNQFRSVVRMIDS